jgi:hypothetical protein
MNVVDPNTIAELKKLGHGWDGHGGVPPTAEALAALKSLQVCPMSRGGLMFEFGDCEFEIGSSGDIRSFCFTREDA